MKKLILFAAVGLIFASCTKDDVIDKNVANLGNADTPIGFNVIQKNTTRAAAQDAGHYEFGVYSYAGADESTALTGSAPAQSIIMQNYLVAYGNQTNFANGTTPYAYYNLDAANPTWGNNDATNAVTDTRKGYSSWFYKGLSSIVGTTWNKADYTQVLKFWDYSKANTYFYAFTPYASMTTETTSKNPDKVTFDTSSKKFTFTKLSAFYTTPVLEPDQTSYTAHSYQIEKANLGAATNFATTLDTYNKEILNYNEANYAHTAVAKAQYGEDVALAFKHLNAKIKLQFVVADALTGYKMKILDMVPESADKGANKFAKTKTTGIVLTPSTQQQASTPLTAEQPETSELPKYPIEATITTPDVTGDTKTIAITAGSFTEYSTGKHNLHFASKPNDTYAETVNTDTWLYVLPNSTSATDWDTQYDAAEYNKTGYTLHVTYELKADDNTSPIRVYDARVWIPADACHWVAGNAYIYKFKITSASTGTTDPQNEVDPNTEGSASEEPYVDPDDPRVPNDPALTPIVFDGITVVDYDNETTTVDPDLEVSSYEFKLSDTGTKYFVSANAILNGESSQFGTRIDPTTVFKGVFEETTEANRTGAWSWDNDTKFTFTATESTHTAYFNAIQTDLTEKLYTNSEYTTLSNENAVTGYWYEIKKRTFIWDATSGQAYAVVYMVTNETEPRTLIGFEVENVKTADAVPAVVDSEKDPSDPGYIITPEQPATYATRYKIYDGTAGHAVPDKAYLLYTH